MFKPLLSIIVPAFNVGPYIKKCISSLQNQSYSNLEIIIVDDCSQDDTSSICKEIIKQDNRVRLVENNKNLGVSAARNIGIKQATGNYLMFVDGDDFLLKDAVELLINDFNNGSNVIMSSFQLQIVYNVDETPNHETRKDTIAIKNVEDELVDLLKWNVNSSSCCKIYKKEMIKSILFVDNKHINEDRFFVFEYLINSCGYIICHSKKMYACLERNNSACRSAFSRKYDDMLYFADCIIEKIENSCLNNNRVIKEAANYNLVKTNLMYIKYAMRSKNWRDNFDICKARIDFINAFLKKQKVSLGKHRIEVILLNCSIRVYRLMLIFFDTITAKKTY